MKQSQETLTKLLKKNKIKKSICDLFEKCDRKLFFDNAFKDKLFENEALPIGYGQNSDPPLILAKMLHLVKLKKKQRVLEIGTGSGYSTALLSHIADEVISIEYNENLARSAKTRITGLKRDNIRFFAGDATDLSSDLGEFDAVIIWAACHQSPIRLLDLLKDNGTAVYPQGPAHQQQICVYSALPGLVHSAKNFAFYDFCVFNSIRGPYGWIDQVEGYITDEANV